MATFLLLSKLSVFRGILSIYNIIIEIGATRRRYACDAMKLHLGSPGSTPLLTILVLPKIDTCVERLLRASHLQHFLCVWCLSESFPSRLGGVSPFGYTG